MTSPEQRHEWKALADRDRRIRVESDELEEVFDAVLALLAENAELRAALEAAEQRAEQLRRDRGTLHALAERRLAENQRLRDGITALHDDLFAAMQSVYRRHDGNRPLNHVNTVEWVEAVEKVLDALLKPTERDGEPRCLYVSPSPWGYTQCCLPAHADSTRHAYSPSETVESDRPEPSSPHTVW